MSSWILDSGVTETKEHGLSPQRTSRTVLETVVGVSVQLLSSGTDGFWSRLSLKENCYLEQPWKTQCLHLEHGPDRLIVQYKRLGVPKLRVSYKATQCVWKYQPAHFVLSCENWEWKTSSRKCLMVWLLLFLWVINGPLSLTPGFYVFLCIHETEMG